MFLCTITWNVINERERAKQQQQSDLFYDGLLEEREWYLINESRHQTSENTITSHSFIHRATVQIHHMCEVLKNCTVH